MPQLGTHISHPLKYKAQKVNSNGKEWFSNLTIGNDPDFTVFMNDYLKASDYSTADTTLTLVGTGTAVVNTTSNDINGVLLITTGAANGPDSCNLQNKGANVKFDASVGSNNAALAGKRLWFETALAVSNVADVDLFIGLSQISTTIQSANDRAGFRMTNGAATVALEASLGGVLKSQASGQSLVAATQTMLGMRYDGGNAIHYYINRNWVGTATVDIPTADLAYGIYVASNSANARTASVDYWFIAKER